LTVIVTCFTRVDTTFAIDYSVRDILQKLFYDGRREPFANLR